MAVILSTGQANRLEPTSEAGKPEAERRVYWLATPTRWTDAAYDEAVRLGRAAVADALGIGSLDYHPLAELLDLAEHGIETIVAEEQRPVWRELLAARRQAAEAGRPRLDDADAEAAWGRLEEALRLYFPPYRHALQDRNLTLSIAAEAAARRFVMAIENGPAVARDRDGLLPEVLAGIPFEHQLEIMAEVERLRRPTETEAKN